jgi:LuxR family maltose regulon positive regulatory protein
VVREALGTEFAARLPRERERAQRVTAEWLYDTGDGFGAFALAVRAGDYDYAARVTRTELFELLGEHGRDVLLLLQPVSRLTLRRYPLLTLMLALISNARGHRVRAAEYFALTTIGARAARKTADPEERIVLLAVESASLRVAGRIGPAMRAARAFEAAVDEIPVERFERLAPIAPALFAHVGITLLYGGAGDDALAAFERAHSFSVPGSDFELQPLALLAGTHAIRGELDRARALVARIRSGVWRGDAINGYRGAFLHLAEAIIGVDEADFTGARDRLQVMAPHLDTLEHWPLFAWVLALCDLGLGVPAHSDVVLKRELRDRRRASITSLTGMVLLATRANLLLASGQATEATAVLASAASTPITRPASARVALLAGDAERTITELAPLEADALPPRTAAEVQLLVAAASLRLGREDAARSAAESAAAILVTSGLRHPLSLLPREDRDDLAALLTPTARELLGDAGVPELFPRRVSVVTLTARERAVLERLAQGGTLPEIAAELHVSVNTLKTQLRSVYRKLGAGDRESALAAAQGHGLLGG